MSDEKKSKYSEAEATDKLRKRGFVCQGGVIDAPRSFGIGSWALVDYLTHHCKYRLKQSDK